MKTPFLDIKAARTFIERAVKHYDAKPIPPWFIEWLNDLYIRLGEQPRSILLDELLTLATLEQGDGWTPQMLAVNTVYKYFDRAPGRDTTSLIDH